MGDGKGDDEWKYFVRGEREFSSQERESEVSETVLQFLPHMYIRHPVQCYSVALALQCKSPRSSMQVEATVILKPRTRNASP